MSFLAYKNTDELFDFQLLKNFNNWKFGITKAPNDNVLPFSFKIFDGGQITTFEARKVSISNDTVTLLDTITLVSYRVISAIAENVAGVSYKVTTSVAHGYITGDVVTQSGFVAPDAAYNGDKTILSVPTTTSYIVAGTYTSSKTGLVNKDLVTITQINDSYSIKANEGLDSNLANGIYYYYYSDGYNTGISDLFCIDGTIQYFNIYLIDEDGNYLVDEADNFLVTFI